MGSSPKIRLAARLLFFLLLLGTGAFFVKLGIQKHDSFYYLLALIVFSIDLFSLIRKERMPVVKRPEIKLKQGLKGLLVRFRGIKLSSAKSAFDTNVKTNSKVLSLLLGTLASSLALVYIVVYLLPQSSETNIVLAYVKALFDYFKQKPLISLLVVFIALAVNLAKHLKRIRNNFRSSSIPSILLTTIGQLIISIPTSLLLAFLIAILFSNSVIVASGILPHSVDFHTDKNEIRQIIDKSDSSFNLVGITSSPTKTLVINTPYLGKKSDFFSYNLIPSLPNIFLLSPTTINHPIFLTGNTLIIKEIDKDIIQTISPTLVKKLIKKDLSPRFIKDEPSVEIISRQDYLKYREDQINKQIDEITGYIDEAKKALGVLAYNIKVSKDNITTLQSYIVENTRYRDEEYNYCINATRTYYGWYSNYTYRLYSDEYCQNQRAKRDQANAEYQAGIETNQKNLNYYQSQYNEFKQYLDQFQNYKEFVEATKQLTPYELGLFEPQSTVKVVLDSVGDKDISNFMETLTHEYIHYSSYVSEERVLPQFFEEGITELLARRVISNQLRKTADQGYPVVVEVIEAMTKDISLSQLEDIYFNKSADQLETLLNDTYGKDFYKDSELYFALIPYSPPEEAVIFANNIMSKIGGPTLEEKDFLSD